MNTDSVSSNVFHLETVSSTESLDEILADENFFDALTDLINQNFVLEVEASRIHKETTGENGSNADFIQENWRDLQDC